MAFNFEWDPKKSRSNSRKHGVSFEEAITVFGDPLSLNMPDPDHSEGERRYLVLGTSGHGRLLLVAYVERPPRTRIISAREASRPERRMYEDT